MTGTSLMKINNDTRLLLFQALEYGMFKGSFIQKMKKDLTGMSLQFAQKYYKATYEVYLAQASKNVLGVINLSLVLQSDGDVYKAALLLQIKSVKELFQFGWRQITQKTKMAKQSGDLLFSSSLLEMEKDLAERLSAEPGKHWIGLSEFQAYDTEVTDVFGRMLIKKYLVEKHRQKGDGGMVFQGASVVDRGGKGASNTMNILISTFFISLLISDTPHFPLDIEEAELLVNKVQEPTVQSELEQRLLAFTDVPRKLRPYYVAEVTCFMDNVMAELVRYIKGRDPVDILSYFFNCFYLKADPDKVSEDRYESVRATVAERFDQEKSGETLSFFAEVTDASDRLAYIDFITERADQFKAEDIRDLISLAEDDWQGKISWDKMDLQVIFDLMELSVRNEVVEDIFHQNQEEDLLQIWSNLPNNTLLSLFREVAVCREHLLQNVFFSASELEKILHDCDSNSLDGLILFVYLLEWYNLWVYMDYKTMDADLFSIFIQEYKQLSYSVRKINELVFERVTVIITGCKRTQGMTDDKAPFYNKDLVRSLKGALTQNQFYALRKKLLKDQNKTS